MTKLSAYNMPRLFLDRVDSGRLADQQGSLRRVLEEALDEDEPGAAQPLWVRLSIPRDA